MLTSTNSMNSTYGSMVRLAVTVVGIPDDGKSGIARLMTADSEVISRKVGTLLQLGARSTAALASHHSEAVLVIEVVAIRARAVLERALLPAGIVGVVLASRACQDEFDVTPRQRVVGLAHQRDDA